MKTETRNGHGLPRFVRDHIELFKLELAFEKRAARRRMISSALVAFFGLNAVIFAEILTFQALLMAGLGTAGAAGALLFASAAGAALSWFFIGRRDPRAGTPFEGTRAEVVRSAKWIRTILS